MSIQIKYAYRRHNTWTYRRTYPQHLRDILGSSLKQSLKTSDAKIARKRVENAQHQVHRHSTGGREPCC